MRELAPGYKPVVIGCEQLPSDLEEGWFSTRFAGLDVLTDSLTLHQQVKASETELTTEPPLATFRYLVNYGLPFVSKDSQDLERQGKTHPGEIYMHSDLQNYYFQGNDKFGTLASIAYGIRALRVIEHGRLGLHSSLIWDQEKETATLIVGRNHAGKSTIGQAIEDSDERFLMLADDWNEVDLTNSTITPISQVFSPDRPNSRYELAFKSFGKPFYRKYLPASLPPLALERIIELHDGSESPEPEAFILRSLTHIPFIKQPINEATFVCDGMRHIAVAREIEGRKQDILNGYHQLVGQHETVKIPNDHSKNSLDDVINKVKGIIE